MRRLRTVLFWGHLSAGVTAGLVIATMAVSGSALALERPVLAWLERPAAAPEGVDRKSLDELVARARDARSGAAPSGVTVRAAAGAPVLVSFGREDVVAVDPYTGAAGQPIAAGARRFFRFTNDLHRQLAVPASARAGGKAVTGVANLAFFFLALSGLYLWLPRKWARGVAGLSLWFQRGLRGKARNWNWHNVIGFWCAPVLVVLTVSGAVISYRWASDLVYRVAGSAPQAPGGRAGVELPPRPEGGQPVPLGTLFDEAASQAPAWESITMRFEASRSAAGPVEAISLTVREMDPSPRFASTQLWMDPFTGKVLRRESYASADAGRQARLWLRFLHTGEALGWMGQLVAAVASLGGTFLAYTGLALALRRLLGWRADPRFQLPGRSGPSPGRGDWI
jgi:uncharacterized iron-regulated membrane protein